MMKTNKDKQISVQQLKALHATFHRIGMDDDARHGCIYEFTSGRTVSSRELTMHEARQLLERLKKQGRCIWRKRKVCSATSTAFLS
mgnify:CR=1 FL=1